MTAIKSFPVLGDEVDMSVTQTYRRHLGDPGRDLASGGDRLLTNTRMRTKPSL